jgi:hypothetical protein
MNRFSQRTPIARIAALLALTVSPFIATIATAQAPQPDPRVGLRAGVLDSTNRVVTRAAEAGWNLRLVSQTPPPPQFIGAIHSDLAFKGNDVIQGNYNGYEVWDITHPEAPTLKTSYYCPASQNDVSVYQNLIFMSSESGAGRLDCGSQGVKDTVSQMRMRGVRIFDIGDLANPKYIANVQTCRGSHTHSLLVDPKDPDNVYVYVSGSANVRSPNELAGCVGASPATDPNSAHFRIEVIKVPLAHPEQAAIVSSPRIFNDLAAPPGHGPGQDDIAELAKARAAGAYIAHVGKDDFIVEPGFVNTLLDSVVKARNGTGAPTAADSAALHTAFPDIVARLVGPQAAATGPDQCHDITLYPAIGRAGGACGGYGLLLDIRDPAHPVRLAAAADSNFSYWHSATFNNDGTKVLFSDEWGGGGAPKCRATDKHEWGADAIFALENNNMVFKSYYKMPAPQTSLENCVAHNGSLIPIPGRDVMVQAWYQGGVSVFDWTDAAHPTEVAFFDRGPLDGSRMALGGSWSAYWYNGVIVSSEIVRGLDIFELTPSPLISQNEIDAAKTVHSDYLNVQGQQKFVWPPSFSLARAYLDQLDRSRGLAAGRISAARVALASAEQSTGTARNTALTQLATSLYGDASGAADKAKVQKLAAAVNDLANAQR